MDIARFRKARGLSQRDVAEILGCDQSTVQRAETMHKSAKLTTYQEYANAFGVQLWQLFSDDVTPDEVEILKIFRRVPKEKHDDLFSLLKLARETDS